MTDERMDGRRDRGGAGGFHEGEMMDAKQAAMEIAKFDKTLSAFVAKQKLEIDQLRQDILTLTVNARPSEWEGETEQNVRDRLTRLYEYGCAAGKAADERQNRDTGPSPE